MASSVNLDVAERLDITCRRGDTFSLTLTLTDSSGDVITLATSGYEFLMDVKTPVERTRSGVSKRQVIASSTLSPSNLPVGSFEYDIQQKVGDVVTTILRGSFTVNEDISR